MKKTILIFALVTMIFGKSGLEIAQKVDERKTPLDMKSDLTMVLTNKKGKTRTSTMRSISKDDGEKQIIWFLAPADDKGVAFLKIEHDNNDDEMRMWLPAFKKIRRISSKKKADSLMGSDMSYEDISSRNINDYAYENLGEEEVIGILCWKLKAIPKEGVTKTYNHHITWISKDKLLVLKEESYDKTGKLLKAKSFTYTKIKEYDTPVEILVKNVQKNHSTKLTFGKIELDTEVEDNIFQEKNLKRMRK